jgi:AcrR family transcriptional regulator
MHTSSPASPVARVRATHLGPERRRPLILDVAFGLFVERGYKGTSMDAIAQAAGVTKPVIYDSFASKAELFGALIDREEQRMFAQFGAAFATGVQSKDPQAVLTAGFTAMLRAVSDTPETYRVALLGGKDTDTLIDARIRRGREQLVGQLSEVVRNWLERRAAQESAPEEQASVVRASEEPAPQEQASVRQASEQPTSVERTVEARTSERRFNGTAEFVAQTLVGVGDAGVRMMLTSPDRWTPETLGRTLGRFAAAGYAAFAES